MVNNEGLVKKYERRGVGYSLPFSLPSVEADGNR